MTDRLLRSLPIVGRLFDKRPRVAVLRLSGVITAAAGGFRRALDIGSLAPLIRRAFAVPRLSAVALVINSPGGSPAQSSLIAGRIRALSEEKEVPIFAFVEDVAASGGYWLACAADEIYADANSIVGSIGVISAGFGFQNLIARYGIERRVHTTGRRKSMLDPFRPEQPEDVLRLQALQADIHKSFVDHVRARRGVRLKADDETLFSGEFWTAGPALELGLVDGLGDARTVLRRKFGEDVQIVDVEPRRGWLRSRFGMAAAPLPSLWADDLAAGFLAAVEERAVWSRFGL